MNKKTVTYLFAIICNIFLFSGILTAQTESKGSINVIVEKKPKELVLGVPKISDKTLYMIIEVINQTDGLKYVSYCTKHKLVLLTYDLSKFARPEEVVQAINDQNFNLDILIKTGSFREIKEMCSQN